MPTATSFTALGRGNGFPFCASKVDVTQGFNAQINGDRYEGEPGAGGSINWVTLGGVSSGSASQAQIDLSLSNAMKLYYNFYSVQAGNLSASSEAEGSYSSSVSTEADNTNAEAIFIRSGESDALIPSRRVCQGTSIAVPGFSTFIMQALSRDSDADGANNSGASISSNVSIIRMYNGSTDNESNFVGYGVEGVVALASAGTDASVPSGGGGVESLVSIKVGSISQGDNESGSSSDGTLKFDQKYYNCNLGGMPFVARTYCESTSRFSSTASGTKTQTVQASELSGTASSNFSANESDDTVSGESECEASISGFNYYTY
jgi:hypothetical protein